MSPPGAKNPCALAGRLRRAQTFLRMLDLELAFGREGRSGARMIRMNVIGPAAPGLSEWIGRTSRMRGIA
jgi:hypothetical protein